MKRILLSLITLYSVVCFGQKPISSINISLPAQPAANTAAWASAIPPLMITAQARLVNGRVDSSLVECRVLVTIKSGGNKICGSYTQQTAPFSNFNAAVKNWTGTAAVALLGKECTLPPGSYELCVQFFRSNPATGQQTVVGEACKSFTIADTKQQSYSPPQNVMPADGKQLSETEAIQPVMFRWTPVSPRPKADVVYKVRVIEILPGQNKTEALRSNTPLDILEVKNNTQVSYKLSKRINGLYWEVEAESAQQVQGEKPQNYGKSEATSIKIGGAEHKNDWPQKSEVYSPPVNQMPVDGKVFTKEEAARPINLKWIPVQPKPQRPVNYKVTIKQVEKGQTPAQAMKANKAIDVLEVKDETQTTYKLAQRTNNVEYVWNVEAVSAEIARQGENPKSYGASGATSFMVSSPAIMITNFKATCGANYGTYTYTVTIENTGSNPFNLTTLGFASSSGIISSVTSAPAIPSAVINPGVINALTITGGFTYTGTYNAGVVVNASGFQVGNPLLTSQDTEMDSIYPCVCHDCDQARLSVNNPSVAVTNANTGVYTATGSINISGLPSIYGIEMQVLTYSYSATPASCSNGVTSVENSGVFYQSGTTINSLPVSMLNETVSGLPSTNNGVAKNIRITSATALPASIPFNLVMGLPTPLPGMNADCCKMTYKVCIKIKVFYDKDKCRSCVFTYCFPVFSN
jgi:hypothetical protein